MLSHYFIQLFPTADINWKTKGQMWVISVTVKSKTRLDITRLSTNRSKSHGALQLILSSHIPMEVNPMTIAQQSRSRLEAIRGVKKFLG